MAKNVRTEKPSARCVASFDPPSAYGTSSSSIQLTLQPDPLSPRIGNGLRQDPFRLPFEKDFRGQSMRGKATGTR